MSKIGLIKIDHHGAIFYSLGGESEKVVDIIHPYDPNKHRWHLHKKFKSNWKGQRASEDHHFFKELINDMRSFDGLVIASHGKGKSNEGILFEKFLEKHHKDLHKIVISQLDIDDHHMTENELLAQVDHDSILEHIKK